MDNIVTQRLKDIIKEKGESVTSFSEIIGISQSTLSCQMRSVKGIGLEVILATLEKFPDISAEWLLRGTGSMFFDETLPAISGEETDSELSLKIDVSKLIAEKEELLEANLALKEELTKKIGCIEGLQDYISKLIIENNILIQKLGLTNKKDIV